MMNILTVSLIIFFAISFITVASMYILQRKLIYYPERFKTLPSTAGLANVAEINLETPDSQTLIAWYSKAEPGKPTILYFHGNGGSLRNRTDRIMLMQRRGYGVFMLSYRGYGGSTGSPSEKKIIADALMSYDWLLQNGVKDGQVVLYGESLGTGVAVHVAVKRKAACVILEAPYTSLPDVAKRIYPFLPTRTLMLDHYDSARRIDKIETPLLIIHGAMDTVIPVKLGRELFEQALHPKAIEVFPYGGHSDLYLHGAWDKVTSFMEHQCIR